MPIDHSENIIELSHVSFAYTKHLVVKDVSLPIHRGDYLGIIGPNGGGKTTLLKLMLGLLTPQAGAIKLFGEESTQFNRWSKIGYVPQLISADGDLTGYENLMLSAMLHGLNQHQRETRIEQLLEFMQLKDVADRLVKGYSGGMIRKLEIAQALLHHPKVLFLDEPTVGLDPGAKKAIWNFIKDWIKNFHTTILMTTHDMNEADKLCDNIAFMHQGRIMIIDTPAKLKETLGEGSTLDDAFIYYTGTSVNQGDINDVQQTRRTISHLD